MIKKRSNNYLYFIVTVLGATMLLTILTVLYIINTTFATEETSNYEKAFKWQMEHKGVVGITVNIANEYKQRMLEWRLAKNNVDTLILGSSTVMGIKADMFKDHIVFNGATNSNPLYYTVPVAKYHSKHTKSVKYIMISFDWALGFPYRPYKKVVHNPMIKPKTKIGIVDKIKDALSYQRVKIVLSNLWDHFFGENTFQYQCPKEDTIGTDQFFATDQPKSCHGFRFDGSAVFPGIGLTQKQWKAYLESGLTKYQKQFEKNLGTVDMRYLDDLKEIDKNLKHKGGKLIIQIPPLIPNATTTIEHRSKQRYEEKMQRLVTFAKENNITVLDASKSETFGCTYSDFLDAHHAFPSCYQKILTHISF